MRTGDSGDAGDTGAPLRATDGVPEQSKARNGGRRARSAAKPQSDRWSPRRFAPTVASLRFSFSSDTIVPHPFSDPIRSLSGPLRVSPPIPIGSHPRPLRVRPRTPIGSREIGPRGAFPRRHGRSFRTPGCLADWLIGKQCGPFGPTGLSPYPHPEPSCIFCSCVYLRGPSCASCQPRRVNLPHPPSAPPVARLPRVL